MISLFVVNMLKPCVHVCIVWELSIHVAVTDNRYIIGMIVFSNCIAVLSQSCMTLSLRPSAKPKQYRTCYAARSIIQRYCSNDSGMMN